MTPYLMFNGNCEEALQFYKKCLNGFIGYVGRYGDSPIAVSKENKNLIFHMEFRFWGGALMASDYVPEVGFTTPAEGSNVHLNLSFDSEEKMNAIFEKLSEGAEVLMALQTTFGQDRFGLLKDKFGIHWMFHKHTISDT